jgi:Tfp pilus assembly protein PilO
VTKNPKLLIAVVALVAAAGAYWMLVLSPKRAELAKLDTDLVAAQGELSSAQATLGTYEKAQGAYRRNYATVVRLGKAVPADDDVRSLVVQLDSAAEKSGVDFDRIAIGESGATGPTVASDPAGTTPAPPGAVSVGPAGFTAMPFSFAFNGDFDNLSTFFSRLERFVTVSNERIDVTGRLLRLESLSLKPDAEGSHIVAEIGASSYLLPSSEGVTAGGTATAPAATTTTASATPPGTTPPTTTATSTGATIR